MLSSNEGEGGRERRRPMFATGEVVQDYEPLYLYWQEAGERAEETVLSNRDFRELQRILSERNVERLDQLIERLKPLFRERIDREAARRALKRYYGVEFTGEQAVDTIAGILAGWLVEAGTVWDMLRLRRRWEREEGGEAGKQQQG